MFKLYEIRKKVQFFFKVLLLSVSLKIQNNLFSYLLLKILLKNVNNIGMFLAKFEIEN